MIQTTLYTQDHGLRERVPDREIDTLVARPENLLWIDVTAPSRAELERLKRELNLHPLIIEELTQPSERSRIRAYEHVYAIVVYAIRLEEDDRIGMAPIHLILGSHFLLTVHREPIRALEEVIRRWKENTEGLDTDVGLPVYNLLDTMVDYYFPVIDQIAERVDEMEDRLFEGTAGGALEKIFTLKKDLLELRRRVAPARDVVNVLLRRELPIFSEKSVVYFQDVYDHIVRVTDSIDTYRDLLSSALDTYLSVTSNRLAESANRLNQIMQTLTSWSIILMSAGVVAGIYGMNFKVMPELEWRYGYPLALGLMVILGGGLFVYFRGRKWI
jgi:magnesium transporter